MTDRHTDRDHATVTLTATGKISRHGWMVRV